MNPDLRHHASLRASQTRSNVHATTRARLRWLERYVSGDDLFQVLIDIEVHHFTSQRERSTCVADADITRIAAAPWALKQTEGTVTILI